SARRLADTLSVSHSANVLSPPAQIIRSFLHAMLAPSQSESEVLPYWSAIQLPRNGLAAIQVLWASLDSARPSGRHRGNFPSSTSRCAAGPIRGGDREGGENGDNGRSPVRSIDLLLPG